jgi:predicted membrane chloride channel (bestrophin family)
MGHKMQKLVPSLFLIASFAIAAFFVYMSSDRNLTTLENSLFQIFTLAVGLIGSYLLGRESTAKNARELMKPHARSAFRRLVALYRGLSRIGGEIQVSRLNLSADQYINSCLGKLEGMVTEQIATAADALEDWNDIVPEDVQELKQKLEALNQEGPNNE